MLSSEVMQLSLPQQSSAAADAAAAVWIVTVSCSTVQLHVADTYKQHTVVAVKQSALLLLSSSVPLNSNTPPQYMSKLTISHCAVCTMLFIAAQLALQVVAHYIIET
eukprot:6590-Heterococcus_DN1.PRE.2